MPFVLLFFHIITLLAQLTKKKKKKKKTMEKQRQDCQLGFHPPAVWWGFSKYFFAMRDEAAGLSQVSVRAEMPY